MSLGEYLFLSTNLLTVKVIAEVNLQSMHWDEFYNRPGSGRATARIHDEKTTPENFQPWGTGLWVVKDGDLRFGGIMGQIAPRSGTNVIDIPVVSFAEYLRKRLIRNITNMSFATMSGNNITWTDRDQFEIAADVIAHTQIGNGDLGITTVWDALSGIVRTDTVHTWDFKMSGEYFEDLAARNNGFDWRIEYHYVDDNPTPRMRLKYPRMGRKTGFTLYYKDGTDSNIQSYDVSGGKPPISGVLALMGSGEGDAMVRSTLNPSSGHVDYDEVASFKDVSVVSTLNEHGNYILAQRSNANRTFDCTLAYDQDPGYTEFVCGDDMRLQVDDGYNQINASTTVIAKSIVLTETFDDEVKVQLFEMSFVDEFA
jgi:hypothetical protein